MLPKVYHPSEHGIPLDLIDPDALTVIRRLQQAGFTAYLVGGGVRDLSAGITPKDFDVSTSAKPEQIKGLFQRQCLLIGRRFRLAHIRYGNKIIEVSTFRCGENEDDLIVHDNEWGSEEEDVLRRDFTINGLFYDPSNETVIDYVGGFEDIKKGILRVIGDPCMRFRQDPVRMIRLLKFRARLDFNISEEALEAMKLCQKEIIKSSSARILEEILRMLESGASAPFFHLMTESGMLRLLFPGLTNFLQSPQGMKSYRFLVVADQINQSNPKRPLSRPVLTACLLFPILEQELKTQYLDHERIPHINDVLELSSAVIHHTMIDSFSHFPRRISTSMHFILSTQYRLTPFSGKRHHRPRLTRNKEFELALQLFKIRALIDSELMESYMSWKNYWRHEERQGDRRAHHPRKRNEEQQENSCPSPIPS